MATIRNHDPPKLESQAVRRVLYVGGQADEICHFVTQHVGEIDITYERRVAAAIQLLRSVAFDIVMLDLRNGQQSYTLLVPLIQELGTHIKIVVISQFKDVGQYLAVPGVARVLSAPVREGQFLRVLGLAAKHKHFVARDHHGAVAIEPHVPAHQPSLPQKTMVQFLSDKSMVLLSMAYKRSATVLLLTLFTAFMFYGFLIAFFLMSSGWGAPMTLAQGHEMVNKAERELTELRVALSQAEQKITEAKFGLGKAERSLTDGEVMVRYATDTVRKEKTRINRLNKSLVTKIARLDKVRGALQRQLSKDGAASDLQELYNRRLINRQKFNSSALGLLEASQRLAAIESEMDSLVTEKEDITISLGLLDSLQDGLENGEPISSVTAASTDLILLTKQAMDAKAVYDNAYDEMTSTGKLIAELVSNRELVRRQIAALQSTALARAINERIDVIFVPYTNRANFTPGTRLYSCAFTIFYCERVGTVGAPLPGEISSVHPFFGKPIRGYFVEAKLKFDKAATREIIHGGHAPFFF